jgi:hypothetical protein
MLVILPAEGKQWQAMAGWEAILPIDYGSPAHILPRPIFL